MFPHLFTISLEFVTSLIFGFFQLLRKSENVTARSFPKNWFYTSPYFEECSLGVQRSSLKEITALLELRNILETFKVFKLLTY